MSSFNEIVGMLSKLKNNKVPECDRITAKLLKYGDKHLVSFLHDLIRNIGIYERMLSDWEISDICFFHKRGDIQ